MGKRAANLEKKLDAIYAGPATDFVAARNELAKSLRSEDGKEADRVAKLKKPSRAAALVNRLALRKPKAIAQLMDVTEEIRVAMSGKLDRDRVHELGREEAGILDRLVAEAAKLTEGDESPSSTTLERVRETLQAAQVDEDIRERVLAGRLEREERAASVGLGNLLAVPASGGSRSTAEKPKAKPAKKSKPAKRPAASSRGSRPAKSIDRKRLDRAKKSLGEAKEARRAARRDVAAAEGALTKAKRSLAAADGRVERAEAAVEKAGKPA